MIRRAFTIVELLVSIAILAILLVLALSTLKSIRNKANNMVSLSNLKTHAGVFTLYNNDFSSYYPYFTKIGSFNTTLIAGGMQFPAVSYFDAHRTWHIALADEYYNGSVTSDVFYPPNYRSSLNGTTWPLYTPYLYGCDFIAKPTYWSPYTRTSPLQYKATQAGSVTYPSKKVLLMASWPLLQDIGDGTSSSNDLRVPVVACDGSARNVSPDQRVNGYQKGDGNRFIKYGAIHYIDWPPFLHTIKGVHGRDFSD